LEQEGRGGGNKNGSQAKKKWLMGDWGNESKAGKAENSGFDIEPKLKQHLNHSLCMKPPEKSSAQNLKMPEEKI